jgi:hypothetical protein
MPNEQICLKPTRLDIDILTRLKAYLNLEPKLEDRRYFTADNLYRYGLVRLLSEPHCRTVGAWFSRMQHARAIAGTGEFVPSERTTNNGRRIKKYDAFPEKEGA